ncbi:MAG: 4-hydroxy-tetrahydrodipicolinate reductase [bacterium]|nr:4-hydroxy-tetrahydrodipicolinate reductase [bacterium]MDT8395367.1 4-hydroxy-tetrahydrodipicolinate reductase [bacterium]
MIRAIVAGAFGRMGTAVIGFIDSTPGIELAGALEREGHPQLGQALVRRGGSEAPPVRVTSRFEDLPDDVDVLIDFTTPEATLRNLETCAEAGICAVIGTTGLNGEQKEALAIFAGRTPTVFAPNMSVGVNLLFQLAATAAAALGDDYDVEIIEAHHRMKKDAPSGTALRLAEIVAEALGRDLEKQAVYARHGMIGERTVEEIGIQTVRAGDIVGEHTLLLAGTGERIELTHRAHSRDNFARGAVRAALWVADRAPGLYSMADVLGLK